MRIVITKVIILKFLNLTNTVTFSKDRCTCTKWRYDNYQLSTRSSQTRSQYTTDCFNVYGCCSIIFTWRCNCNCVYLTWNSYTVSISSISNDNLHKSTFSITTNRNTLIGSNCIFSSRIINLYSFNLSCGLNISYNR